MEFGVQFFPSVGPDTVTARQYFELEDKGDREPVAVSFDPK